MKTVYLAGPITGLNYAGATDWREYARKKLWLRGINGVSPMRAKSYLASLAKPITGTGEEYEAMSAISRAEGVMARDRYDTRTANIVLANFLGAKQVSVGTCIELGWADAWRVPVVMAIETYNPKATKQKPNNPHHHMMVWQATGWKVPTLDEALDIVIGILEEKAPA